MPNTSIKITKITPAKAYKKSLAKLPPRLQEKAAQKIHLFQIDPSHSSLNTHKLKGKLKGLWSFGVKYHYRILFQFLSPKEILLLDIGTHDVYQ